ncbi:MAG: hypothetical protein EXS43_13380 [Opitutus sp.]|nr:hypothetical protein [Opitutus sp.]
MAASAEPKEDVRAAQEALRQTSFTWETTVRQHSTRAVDATVLGARPEPGGALAVEGKSEPNALTEVTVSPSKTGVAVAITAYFKAGASVGHTPLGWLSRTQIHEARGAQRDQVVSFGGQSVRLYRSFDVALRAMALPIPTEELFDLIAEIKEFREANGEIIGWLPDAVVERLWEDKKAKSAPDIEGRVIFRISRGVLEEYRVELEIGFPAPIGKPATRSVVQWTTRIRAVGATTISSPLEALQKLEN